MKAGVEVITSATKRKAKYDKKRARIVGFLTSSVKVELLEGEAKGEVLKKDPKHLQQYRTPFTRAAAAASASQPPPEETEWDAAAGLFDD